MIIRERLKKLCQRQSSVSSKPSGQRQHLFYFVMLLFLALLLLMPALFHHPQAEPHRAVLADHAGHHYHSALEANMAQLAKFQSISAASVESNHAFVDAKNVNRRKDFRIRQNAPTRMSVAGIDNTMVAPTGLLSSKPSELLDKSPYANFANQTTHAGSVSAVKISHPGSTVPQGEFIFAVLETAIDSDLPGMIRAVITRPVYSYIGEHRLIPEGSRLIGQYSSKTLQGINRIMVIWQRILLPNGISIQIDSPGADSLGKSGLGADSVNSHFFQRFGHASMLSLIGAGAASWGVKDANDNASQQYRTAISHSFQSSAHHSLDHSVAIKPSLSVDQGSRVIVFVAKDLDFYSAVKP
jgi:type IV secretion system protein VirB10